MRPGHDRLGEQGAVHVGVSAGLEHHRTAKMIRVPLQPLALVEHRPAMRRRKAADDQAQRFSGRVRVDGSEFDHRFARFRTVCKVL